MAAPITELPGTSEEAGTPLELHDDAGVLFRHKKRPEWGAAILAWDQGERRAYQFQDGRLRKFRKGYYSMMEPVEEGTLERSDAAVLSSLQRAVESIGGEDSPEPLEAVCSFEAQVELFVQLFPAGFEDPEWVADHRGSTASRVLKRHRDPVLHAAKDALSRDRCERLLESGGHADLVNSACEILESTDLVTLKHVKPLRRLEEAEVGSLAETLSALLHGEGDYGPRFEAWTTRLTDIYGTRPSWRAATALPAIMDPQEQVCVRRSAFIRQAGSIAPVARYSRQARLVSYRNFRRLAFAVRKRLQAAGHQPRDLMDVHDFIWTTLRKSALEHLRR